MADEAAVLVEGMVKRFGATEALRGVDLQVPEGSVCGVLGPNGAGKTTLIRVLTTLLLPDAGRALVDGIDVVADAERARFRFGLAGQYAAVDERLTGRGNLRMFARLYRLSPKQARRRADELLERFELTRAADRVVETYSGGMRRRLDLAASLVVSPSVLFLDEPTTGLDPRGRAEVWDAIRDLVATGTTVVLTTQYLEEADQLADLVAVIDSGRVVARGAPQALKAVTGGERLEVTVLAVDDLAPAADALRSATGIEPVLRPETRTLDTGMSGAPGEVARLVRELDAAGVVIAHLNVRRPSLDDVFLRFTGHPAGRPEAAA
ncbi:ATP-binding cassette domain-containing protein [Actinomadura terrae]|uniref:ATP-binding cassette domain-containing protein n=1 Tax=Actinomadura terrae TaxID=604353 RepID=UPI001FA6A9A3|nr:ATP-binding cassette domain-containing protein [Actinomadura terrae]